jgi:hypothetical protein
LPGPASCGEKNTFLHGIQIEKARHEFYLIHGRIEKKPAKFRQALIGKITPAVEIIATLPVGGSQRGHAATRYRVKRAAKPRRFSHQLRCEFLQFTRFVIRERRFESGRVLRQIPRLWGAHGLL